MYLAQSLVDGLKILGFDKETIKKTSKEKSLEEIFLSTLFMNYLIVLVIFIAAMITNTITINGNELNMPVLFGFLMIYPFAYNLFVYCLYGFFGLMAEMVNRKTHVKPLIAVGFHTAIVYTILVYIIALIAIFNLSYAIFLLCAFGLYFIYAMFVSIHTLYQYTIGQTLIVILLPLLVLFLALLGLFILDIPTSIVFNLLN